MTSALVALTPGPGAPALAVDLESVGVHVIGAAEHHDLVREAVRHAPDVLVCWDRSPDEPLFEMLRTVADVAPLPIVLFTDDHAAEKIERSAACGVQAYVVDGYGAHRLRSTIQIARARFRHEQALRGELREVSRRFEERKLVDRAKGILMRAQQISEDDAFRILRTTSMHSKQRVGRVSQQVIDAAREADAVNRAGQLRMLSQQLVKRYALTVLGVAADGTTGDSVARIDATLASLGRSLSTDTYGDLLEAVDAAWRPLKDAVAPAPVRTRIAAIDASAEALLARADQLVVALQTLGANRSLRVINVSGRQRMLVQRLAKQALLADALGVPDAAPGSGRERTRADFEAALDYLGGIPLVSSEITASLDASRGAWQGFVAALADAHAPSGQAELAALSETLVAAFDRLTDRYERSMALLIG